MSNDSRTARKEAAAALHRAGKGTLEAFADLLESELADAHADMETADSNTAIWRAQGRAMAVRSLMDAITPRKADQGEI